MEAPVYLHLAQAARAWPHTDRPPHPTKVLRRILQGVRSVQRPGERIKLRAHHDGQRWLTTKQWIAEHVAAITADRGGSAPVEGVKERALAARARLAASGW
jgi:hypothetical protein